MEFYGTLGDACWERETLEQLFRAGECVYDLPTVQDLRSYCQAQIGTMWDEVLRFENPHKYYVDLSQPLWDEKQRLLSEYSR